MACIGFMTTNASGHLSITRTARAVMGALAFLTYGKSVVTNGYTNPM